MNQAIIQVVFLIVAAIAGIYVATEIADGNYPLAAAALAAAIVPLIWLFFARKLPLESVLLVGLVAGYFILGKGLSYLRFTSVLFIGEVCLALCFLLYIISVQGGKFRLIPKSSLSIPLLAFGVYSLIHLGFDFRRFQIMALRDSCLAYYTLFFFFSYQLASKEGVASFASWILIAVSPIIMASDIIVTFFPTVIQKLSSLTISGIPIYFPHADASIKGLFGILFVSLFLAFRKGRYAIFGLLGTLLLITYYLIQSRGATFLAIGATAVFIFLATSAQERIQLLGFSAIASIISLSLVLSGLFGKEVRLNMESQISAMNPLTVEKQKSLSASTAQWRLYWWKKIIRDVNRENPFFGLGFGSDIGGDFAREFYKISVASEEHSRTRGAHNAFFTVLGRLGWIGALLFIWINTHIIIYLYKAAIAIRAGLIPYNIAYFWGVVICSFIVSYFQYSWESSYAAIPYWVCLGMGCGHLDSVSLKFAKKEAIEKSDSNARFDISRFSLPIQV